jgi:putative cell wall-binding protein
VTIAGGTNAVSKEIEEELKELKQNLSSAMTIERLAGVDRYETAVQISQKYSGLNQI